MKKILLLVCLFTQLSIGKEPEIKIQQFIPLDSINEKPYSIAIDYLRMVCVMIATTPDLAEASRNLTDGLSPENCGALLKDQSELLKSSPKHYESIILAELTGNLSSLDYNLTMLEFGRVFESALTLFPQQPEIIWSSLDNLLRKVHEKNWQLTTSLRLDRQSRIGTVAGHAFQWAQVTAAGIFVLRMGRGLTLGIKGNRYLSASMRGLSQRSGERLRYFLNSHKGWEKPRYEKNIFEHDGIKYEYYLKVRGANNQKIKITFNQKRLQGDTLVDEEVVQHLTSAEIKKELFDRNFKVMQLQWEKKQLAEQGKDLGEKALERVRLLEQIIKRERDEIAVLDKALKYQPGAAPDHLKELIFRKEVMGSTNDELLTLARERGIVLNDLDWKFLNNLKSRSYFDRLVSQTEQVGGPITKTRKYLLGREALAIYLGAGLGAYAGAKYHQRLYEGDLSEFRDSSLNVLSQAYISTLDSIESRLKKDLEESLALKGDLLAALEAKDLTLLKSRVESEGFDSLEAALEFWALETQDLELASDSFTKSISYLEKNFSLPLPTSQNHNKTSQDTIDHTNSVGGILFDPSKALGLHEALLREASVVRSLCEKLKP